MNLILGKIKTVFDADVYCLCIISMKTTLKNNMKLSIFVMLKRIILTELIVFCSCNEDANPKNTIRLVNFRKLVEETSAENSSDNTRDSNNNFVSFLVQNAKEIFSNSEPTVIIEPDSDNYETITPFSSSSVSILTSKVNTYDDSMGHNLNLEDLSDKTPDITSDDHIKKSTNDSLNITIRNNNPTTYTLTTLGNNTDVTEKQTNISINNTDEVLILEKTAIEEMDKHAFQSGDSSASKTSLDKDLTKRSCIACDNVAFKDCYDPKNKLITSRVCDREEDLCYSMHTPFGIVDRGCFNVNHNLSTYVCSCNLCNYVSISEMPYIFSGKRDWVENVKELSRTKRLRKSILKDMSCLRCEVNATQKTGDMLDNANCLEGNINTLPMQECASNEICGVRAMRSEGYIWRGCLSKPLYNYWWALCDTDLCNYDRLVSIYDDL